MKKRFRLGGGWNNYEGGYIYSFFGNLRFPQGGLKVPQKVEIEKNRRQKKSQPGRVRLSRDRGDASDESASDCPQEMTLPAQIETSEGISESQIIDLA